MDHGIQFKFEFDFQVLCEDYYFNMCINLFGLFYFYLYWNKKEDHSGLYLDTRIPFIRLNFSIYDNRHWDHDNNRWEIYHQEGERVSYDIFKPINKSHGRWYFFKTWRVQFEMRNGKYVRIKESIVSKRNN